MVKKSIQSFLIYFYLLFFTLVYSPSTGTYENDVTELISVACSCFSLPSFLLLFIQISPIWHANYFIIWAFPPISTAGPASNSLPHRCGGVKTCLAGGWWVMILPPLLYIIPLWDGNFNCSSPPLAHGSSIDH